MWEVWGIRCTKCGEREKCRERIVMWAPKSYLTKLSSNKKTDQNNKAPPIIITVH